MSQEPPGIDMDRLKDMQQDQYERDLRGQYDQFMSLYEEENNKRYEPLETVELHAQIFGKEAREQFRNIYKDLNKQDAELVTGDGDVEEAIDLAMEQAVVLDHEMKRAYPMFGKGTKEKPYEALPGNSTDYLEIMLIRYCSTNKHPKYYTVNGVNNSKQLFLVDSEGVASNITNSL